MCYAADTDGKNTEGPRILLGVDSKINFQVPIANKSGVSIRHAPPETVTSREYDLFAVRFSCSV